MKLNALNLRVLALGLLAILGTGVSFAAEGHGIDFPGKACIATSPDGRFVVLNIDSEADSQLQHLGDNHALYLLDLKTPSVKRIHPYGRHVKVLWSPSGSAFVINDSVGSDSSDTLVVMLPRATKISVGSELRKHARGRRIFANHHVYIEGAEWAAKDTLNVRVHGYGDVDPNGFEVWYQYTVGRTLKEIPKPH